MRRSRPTATEWRIAGDAVVPSTSADCMSMDDYAAIRCGAIYALNVSSKLVKASAGEAASSTPASRTVTGVWSPDFQRKTNEIRKAWRVIFSTHAVAQWHGSHALVP